jgi:twitching motility protein PilT
MRAISPLITLRSENRGAHMPDVRSLLAELVDSDASDLHLKVPGRPMLRVGKELVSTKHERLMPRDVEEYAAWVAHSAGIELRGEARVAFGIEGLGRFRAHVGKQRGSWEVVIHRVSTSPPSLDELGDLQGFGSALDVGSGLILVAGSRSRRAIIAGGIRHINERVGRRVVSIESPMGWLHRDSRASVSQREVGVDVASVADAFESCGWQDPDAVFVDDLPTANDVEAALRLAEEGVLVVAGIAITEPGEAVRAFVGRFPGQREAEVCARLSDVLVGVAGMDRSQAASWASIQMDQRELLRAGIVARF